MKKQLANVLTKLGLLIVIALVTAVGSAQAQSLAYKIRVNIPFEFVVADKTMPAGQYSIGRAGSEFDGMVLEIRSADGHEHVVRLSTGVESRVLKNKAILVFHRYGDQYFLSQVWPAAAGSGRELVRSDSERRLVANSSTGRIAKKRQAVETVILTGLE